MQDRSSAGEILALYEGGAISGLEVLSGAWEQCHDKPTLRAQLAQQFRDYPDECIADIVGGGLEKLAAQVVERATQGAVTGGHAERVAAPDRPRE
jgi:hypothetical protein